MSATMVTPGMSFSESRIAAKRGARNCRLSWVSSTTLRLAAEAVADVGRRRVAEHLAGEILRRVQQRSRRRRHHGADIGAATRSSAAGCGRATADRPARRPPRRPSSGRNAWTCSIIFARIVVGERDAKIEPAVVGRQREAVANALHELPLVVLREGQHLLQARAARCMPARPRRRAEHFRHGDARRTVLRVAARQPRGRSRATSDKPDESPAPAGTDQAPIIDACREHQRLVRPHGDCR